MYENCDNHEPSIRTKYTYDGFGQRLIKTISGSNGAIYQFGQDGLLLEEMNSSGVAQADYVYLDGQPLATMNPSAGTLYFLHDDMLGTPQMATDSSQTISWRANYQPFGTTSSVSGTITQNLRFPGQYFDVESGWNHNGFRNYIPDLGRYAEPDPLGTGDARSSIPQVANGYSAGGRNIYSYTGSNPANRMDQLGLWDTTTHSTLIWNALEPCGVDRDLIYLMQLESQLWDYKTGIGSDWANYHAMAKPGQSAADAIRGYNEAVSFELGLAADRFNSFDPDWYVNFTIAIHAQMDSTSPAHRDAKGNPITWPSLSNMLLHGSRADSPFSEETWDDMRRQPQLMQRNLDLIRNSWKTATGQDLNCGCQK